MLLIYCICEHILWLRVMCTREEVPASPLWGLYVSGRERLAFRSKAFFLLVAGVPEAPLKTNGVTPGNKQKKPDMLV